MNSKKNSCRGNYMRKYGKWVHLFIKHQRLKSTSFSSGRKIKHFFFPFFGQNWTKIQWLDWLLQKFLRANVRSSIILKFVSRIFCFQNNLLTKYIPNRTGFTKSYWKKEKALTFLISQLIYLSCSLHRTTKFPNSKSPIFTTKFLF